MRVAHSLLVLNAAALLGLSACQTVEETGRKQFILPGFGESTMVQMGAEAYKQALEKQPISTDKAVNDLVRRVGMRIAEASNKTDYQWEFTVIKDDNTVNAWCLPGGKVAVYTGILKVTGDEAGLATVLGHEVAHATKSHGAERMSSQVLFKGGETALAIALQNKDPEASNLVMTAFGIGAQVGILLPYSRKQETEADQVGTIYMARAGYDPRQALEFWKRMSALGGSGQSPPELLSTHPSNQRRIRDLEAWMPKAEAEYRRPGAGPTTSVPPPSGAAAPPARHP